MLSSFVFLCLAFVFALVSLSCCGQRDTFTLPLSFIHNILVCPSCRASVVFHSLPLIRCLFSVPFPFFLSPSLFSAFHSLPFSHSPFTPLSSFPCEYCLRCVSYLQAFLRHLHPLHSRYFITLSAIVLSSPFLSHIHSLHVLYIFLSRFPSVSGPQTHDGQYLFLLSFCFVFFFRLLICFSYYPLFFFFLSFFLFFHLSSQWIKALLQWFTNSWCALSFSSILCSFVFFFRRFRCSSFFLSSCSSFFSILFLSE